MSLDIYIECPCCKNTVGDFNVTYNLMPMFRQAGFEQRNWNDGDLASLMVEPLTSAIAAMKANPEVFRALNPSNGWGDYEEAVEFLEQLLACCQSLPCGVLRFSR